MEVQVSEDPVVALVDTDATLRCSFSLEPGFSLAQLNLIWQLTDTKQLVHSFTEGRDRGSAFANRTALFPDLLVQGNASLRLQRVRVTDEGSYTCFVSIRDFDSAAVSLQVAGECGEGLPSTSVHPRFFCMWPLIRCSPQISLTASRILSPTVSPALMMLLAPARCYPPAFCSKSSMTLEPHNGLGTR